MSLSGEHRADFAGEERVFRLTPTKGWRRIQELCGAGPPVIARRLIMAAQPDGVGTLDYIRLGGAGSWVVDDIRSPILEGLVGGGMSEPEATKLVKAHIDETPGFASYAPLALEIVLASIYGPPEGESSGEQKGGAETTSPTD